MKHINISSGASEVVLFITRKAYMYDSITPKLVNGPKTIFYIIVLLTIQYFGLFKFFIFLVFNIVIAVPTIFFTRPSLIYFGV